MGWRGVPTGAGLVDGGRPRALVAGEGRGWVVPKKGALGLGWFQRGERWGLVGCSKKGQVQGRGQGRVQGLRRSKFLMCTNPPELAWWGFGSGGVGGRGTGPRDGAQKKKKQILKDGLWGGGGYPPHRSWPGGRGVDQGPWLQDRVGGGGGRAGWQLPSGELGLGWLFQRGASPGKGSGKGWLGGRGGGVQGLRLGG